MTEPGRLSPLAARRSQHRAGAFARMALRAGTAACSVAMTLAVVAPVTQYATSSPAYAQSAACGFQDDFAADQSINPDIWDQNGPVATAVGNAIGTPVVAPTVSSFTSGTGLIYDSNGFSALQSTTTCSGPFTFSTVLTSAGGAGTFYVSLVTSDLAHAVTVQGVFPAVADEVTAATAGAGLSPTTSLYGSIHAGEVLSVTMSVDAQGNASINLSDYGGATLGTATVDGVGTGPFYAIIGSQQGDIDWGTASMATAPQSCWLQDLFGADASLSPAWSEDASAGTPLGAVGSVEGTYDAPSLEFEYATQGSGSRSVVPGLTMNGANSDGTYTGIQAVQPCTAPFSVSATVEGVESDGNTFNIGLTSSDLSHQFSVEANLNPANTPYYGIWAGNTLAAVGHDLVYATPAVFTVYTVTINVDGQGMATATLASAAGQVLGTSTPVSVGTGPLYLILGQREGAPDSAGENTGVWQDVTRTPTGTTVSASLSASTPSVAAVQTVPDSAIPPSALSNAPASGAGDAASAPLASIPLASAPLASIPLASIPLASIAAGSSSASPGLAAAGTALSATPLSSLSVTYPAGCTGSACTGWTGIVAGTPLAGSVSGTGATSLQGAPLQSVTLGQVLANPTAAARLDTVNFGSIGLSSSSLSSLPLASIPLASIPLASIALPGTPDPTDPASVLSTWCTTLSGLGSSCSAFGITSGATTTTVTPLTLALAGIPLASIPLASIPLASIPLASIPLASIPLASIPLASIPLASIPLASIPLASIPLGSIPLASIPLASIPLASIPLASIPLASIPLASIPLASIGNLAGFVNCTVTGLDCTSGTLGDAVQANALVPGTTLGQLIAALVDPATLPGYQQTVLSDLGTYGATTLEQLVDALSDPGSVAGYQATTLADILVDDNTTVPGYPVLTLGDLLRALEPPQSFPWQDVDLSRVPLAAAESAGGSEQYTVPVHVGGAGGTVQVAVTLPQGFAYQAGTATLDGTPAPAPAAGGLTWSVPMSAGDHTFAFSANAGTTLGAATTTVQVSSGSSTSTASASVYVVDGEQPASTTPAGALPLAPGTLNLGYITSATDLGYWSITVSQGQELSLALTNLPADYDMALFGPGTAQLAGTTTMQLPAVTDTLPALTPSGTVEATPGSQDIPLTPPSGDQLYALANVADDSSLYAADAGTQYIQTPPLDAGTYTVQISGYNGASSAAPYLLRAQVLGTATSLSCPPLAFVSNEAPSSAAPVTPAPGTNTLFLVDTQRLAAEYGTTQANAVLSELATAASDSAAGVEGAVVPVDAYSSVQAAYQVWDADPCSVQAANGVVAAISAVVRSMRSADPSITSVVVVGADDQIPFARVADGTVQSNERDYAAGTFAGENNVEADALADGYYFSDDVFAASSGIGVGSSALYLPTAAVGRLIETPSQIVGALQRFVASGGNIDATSGLSTGYSDFTQGAQQISANLKAAGLSMQDLVNTTWTSSDLANALTASPAPGVDSINAHFDFSRALPANGYTSGDESQLFTTAQVAGNSGAYAGRLLFSVGCHSGLDIDTAEVAASGIGQTPDWATTFADAGSLWVANTGYGYMDSAVNAYSVALMTDFSADLGQDLTIGQALAEAKQQYTAGNSVLSPYELKSTMESTLYGLPMYRLHLGTGGTSGQGGTPAPLPTGIDPLTGLSAAQVSVSLATGTGAGQLSEQTAPNGTNYYQVENAAGTGGSTEAVEFRPIEPLTTLDISQPSASQAGQLGLVAHGALIDGLTSQDIAGFSPTISDPEVTAGGQVAGGGSAFPGQIQRVASYDTFAGGTLHPGQQLDLVSGQFIPDPATPGLGTQRLFTGIDAQVLYTSASSPLAGDFTAPTIGTTSALDVNGTLHFAVTATPGEAAAPVEEVLVLYTDASSPGKWQALELASGTTGRWSASAPSPSGAGAEYIVEVVDAAGNVAVSSNNGTDFGSSTVPSSAGSPISIDLSPAAGPGGYYAGPVTAQVADANPGSPALTYSLDGGPATALPASGQVQISGDGPHTLTVDDAAGASATQVLDIDNSGPSIVAAPIPSPLGNRGGGSVVQVDAPDPGAPVTALSYSESGAASAAATLTGTALTLPFDLDLTATGTTTVAITATDAAGLSATHSFDFSVGTPALNCGAPSTPASQWASTNVTVTCQPTDSGGLAPDPALFSSYSATGTSASFTLSTSVEPGQSNASAKTPAATVCSAGYDCAVAGPFGPFHVDRTTPGIDLTSPTDGAQYALGQQVAAGYTCSDPLAGIATCSGDVASGSDIATSTAGRHSFSVTAVDAEAGNTATQVAHYTVLQGTPAVKIDPSPDPALVFTSTVSYSVSVTGAGVTPTGTVTVSDGHGGTCSVTLADGKGQCSINEAKGSYLVTASYGGDNNYTPASAVVGETSVYCWFTSGCLMPNAEFRNANLHGVQFAFDYLASADFAGADLGAAQLSGSYLGNADLAGADLAGAQLTAADLAGANLSGANLSGANLSGANLTGANLTGANLTGAKLFAADLDGANLTSAELSGAATAWAQFSGAIWSSTTCPDGTNSDSDNGTCIGHL